MIGNCPSLNLQGEGARSASQIKSLIAFGLERIDQYENAGGNIEGKLLESMPREMVNTFRAHFIEQFATEIENLFKSNEENAQLELHHVDAIFKFIKENILVFNESMQLLIQETRQWKWEFKEISFDEMINRLHTVANLIDAWHMMEEIQDAENDTEEKIECLETIEEMLPDSADLAWSMYGRIKIGMLTSFAKMSVDTFYSNTGKIFFSDNQDDEEKKKQINEWLGKIAEKLGTEAPENHIENEVINDSPIANTEQEKLNNELVQDDEKYAEKVHKQLNPNWNPQQDMPRPNQHHNGGCPLF